MIKTISNNNNNNNSIALLNVRRAASELEKREKGAGGKM